MTEIAAFLKITFLALIVFYVCIQVALLISEVGSAEKAADAVPRAFRGEVSLAEHRKAIDFTAEVIQSDTVNALAGAAVALIFTLGGGLDILWAFVSVLTGTGALPPSFSLSFSLRLFWLPWIFRSIGGATFALTSATGLKEPMPVFGCVAACVKPFSAG